MEIVSILRTLWRHRILLLLGLVPAVLVGLKMVGSTTVAGVASSRVLLNADEQETQRLTDSVNGSLGVRTVLLSELLTTAESRAAIARSIGVEPDRVAVFGPSSEIPPVAVPLALRATETARLAYEPYALRLKTEGEVPIVAMRASGPSAAAAAKMIDAAVDRLERLSASDGKNLAKLRIERLGVPVQSEVVDEAKPFIGGLAGIVTFLLWASALVLVSGLARRWRARRAASALPAPS